MELNRNGEPLGNYSCSCNNNYSCLWSLVRLHNQPHGRATSVKLETVKNITKYSIESLPLNLGLPIKPKYLWLETTDRCNSKCITCNIWKKPHVLGKDLLSTSDLCHCLKDPLMANIKYILNSGGEPTLINLEDIIEVEHSILPKASLQISSNALLPNRLAQAIEYAMSIGVKHLDVGLSIDGIGETHDRLRGVEGNFAKLELTLELLKRMREKYPNRIFVTMGSTLTDITAQEAEKLYAYSQKINVSFMWHWFNSSQFYENRNSKLAIDKGTLKVISEYPFRSLYVDMWQKSLETKQLPKFRCRSLETFMVIRCNGDVVPCLSCWNESIGNIKQQELSTIWKSVSANIERLKIKSCSGCLNSWGYGWSVPETYYPILFDLLKRKLREIT